jgi:hypothetical protein
MNNNLARLIADYQTSVCSAVQLMRYPVSRCPLRTWTGPLVACFSAEYSKARLHVSNFAAAGFTQVRTRNFFAPAVDSLRSLLLYALVRRHLTRAAKSRHLGQAEDEQRRHVVNEMKTGDYTLSKRLFSFLGNYKVSDSEGTTVMRFDGHLRIALRFDAFDAQGRALFRGQGRLIDASNGVAFNRNGRPYGSMHAEWEGGLRREGPQRNRYIINVGADCTLETRGDCSTSWSLMRQEAELASVARRGRKWSIRLLDGTLGEFVLTVVMAVVHKTLGDERSLA